MRMSSGIILITTKRDFFGIQGVSRVEAGVHAWTWACRCLDYCTINYTDWREAEWNKQKHFIFLSLPPYLASIQRSVWFAKSIVLSCGFQTLMATGVTCGRVCIRPVDTVTFRPCWGPTLVDTTASPLDRFQLQRHEQTNPEPRHSQQTNTAFPDTRIRRYPLKASQPTHTATMDPFSTESELFAIQSHFHQGQYAAVIDYDLSTLSPENHPAANVLVLRAKIASGQAKEVLGEVKGADEPELKAVAALAASEAGKVEEAAAGVEKLAEEHEGNGMVQVLGGIVLFRAGKVEEALALLGKHEGNRELSPVSVSYPFMEENRSRFLRGAKDWG